MYIFQELEQGVGTVLTFFEILLLMSCALRILVIIIIFCSFTIQEPSQTLRQHRLELVQAPLRPNTLLRLLVLYAPLSEDILVYWVYHVLFLALKSSRHNME